jgi:hypothetical protein
LVRRAAFSNTLAVPVSALTDARHCEDSGEREDGRSLRNLPSVLAVTSLRVLFLTIFGVGCN